MDTAQEAKREQQREQQIGVFSCVHFGFNEANTQLLYCFRDTTYSISAGLKVTQQYSVKNDPLN